MEPDPFSIVGGRPVSPQDPIYKMTVALSSSVNTAFCSGILVSAEVVLTAAHCLAEQTGQIYVTFGSPAGTQGTIFRTVTSFQTHQLYDPDFHSTLSPTQPRYDIAIVRLNQRAPVGALIADLLSPSDVLRSGEQLELAGFGSQKYIPHIPGKLMALTSNLQQVFRVASEFSIVPVSGQGPCRGDSGGPAFVTRQSERYVAGIASRGDLCEGQGIYTDVSSFYGWVAAVL